MSNGDTLENIEQILLGEEEIPPRVSNKLVFMGIQLTFQKAQAVEDKYDEILKLWHENKDNINNLDTAMKLQLQSVTDKVENLQKTSNRWDRLLALATAIGTSLGFYFGQK